MGCYCSARTKHIRHRDFCDAVGGACYRTNRESGVAGLALELGAGVAFGYGDRRLGIISAWHGGVVGLGIILVSFRTSSGVGCDYRLDAYGCVQLSASCALAIVARG